ncbi:MAG: hypothetical protein HDT28_06615 [Clostridiales bacterium]|nr:hypothetical protein [Clostridiales bacterium]
MDKYSGCNVVESKVTTKPTVERKKTKKDRPLIGFLIRLLVAGAIVGGIVALHYVDLPFLGAVRTALEKVFCYDVFGRSGFGSSAYFG